MIFIAILFILFLQRNAFSSAVVSSGPVSPSSSVVSGDDATIDGLFATFLRGGAAVLAAVAAAAGMLFSFRNPFPEQTNAT